MASAGAATNVFAGVLASDRLSYLELAILGIFFLSFAWISSAFWTALAGLRGAVLGRPGAGLRNRRANCRPTTRTALVVPIYHEDPEQVGVRIAATYRSLADTGQLSQFDLFILSDSRERDVVRRGAGAVGAAVRRARCRRPAVLSQSRRERGPQGRQHRRFLPALGRPLHATSWCSMPTA